MKKFLIPMIAVFALLLVVAPASAKNENAKGPAPKVPVCHVEGNGSYHMINISENALPAHLEHGDGLPTDEGFNSDCTLKEWELFETVTVPSRVVAGDNSSVLDSGVKYKFVARGTYIYAPWAGDPIADAKFSWRGSADPLGLSNQWVDGALLPSSYANYLQIWINGSPVSWIGALDLVNHEYTYMFTGTGASVNFKIQDGGAVGDNFGELYVDIYSMN